MKTRTSLAILASILLSSCTATMAVRGQVQESDETFTGTAMGYSGGGELVVVSSNGTTCRGDYVYTTGKDGEGVFSCADGRSGPFRFSSNGTSGTGYSDLGGQRLTFTIGAQ